MSRAVTTEYLWLTRVVEPQRPVVDVREYILGSTLNDFYDGHLVGLRVLAASNKGWIGLARLVKGRDHPPRDGRRRSEPLFEELHHGIIAPGVEHGVIMGGCTFVVA